MLAELQAAMRHRLLSLDGDAPAGIVADGIPAEERFDIYRRSVVLSLEHCLADAFPATEDLLGRLWFRPAARAFARNFPPQAPQLSSYGEAFPAFLAANGAFDIHEAAPDLAQLEWTRMTAYFADDAPTPEINILAQLASADAETLRLLIHPSFKPFTLMRPDPTVLSVLVEFGATRIPSEAGQPVAGGFAIRSAGMVHMGLAGTGEVTLLSSLAGGASLKDAAEMASAEAPATDLQAVLSRHLQLGTFIAIH